MQAVTNIKELSGNKLDNIALRFRSGLADSIEQTHKRNRFFTQRSLIVLAGMVKIINQEANSYFYHPEYAYGYEKRSVLPVLHC